MKQEIIKSELEVNDNKIKVITINNKEFISLTDLARYANPEEPKIPIQTWLRNKDVMPTHCSNSSMLSALVSSFARSCKVSLPGIDRRSETAYNKAIN